MIPTGSAELRLLSDSFYKLMPLQAVPKFCRSQTELIISQFSTVIKVITYVFRSDLILLINMPIALNNQSVRNIINPA